MRKEKDVVTTAADNEDILRSTLQAGIEQEYADQLSNAIEAAKEAHQLRVERALDAAILAIRGKTKTPARKKTRKPRADKGTKRLKRGLPETPVDVGEACSDCEHYASHHDNGTGACGIKGCECKTFTTPADKPGF